MCRYTTVPIRWAGWGYTGAGMWVTGAMKYKRYGTRLDFENTSHGHFNRFHGVYSRILFMTKVFHVIDYY